MLTTIYTIRENSISVFLKIHLFISIYALFSKFFFTSCISQDLVAMKNVFVKITNPRRVRLQPTLWQTETRDVYTVRSLMVASLLFETGPALWKGHLKILTMPNSHNSTINEVKTLYIQHQFENILSV